VRPLFPVSTEVCLGLRSPAWAVVFRSLLSKTGQTYSAVY